MSGGTPHYEWESKRSKLPKSYEDEEKEGKRQAPYKQDRVTLKLDFLSCQPRNDGGPWCSAPLSVNYYNSEKIQVCLRIPP